MDFSVAPTREGTRLVHKVSELTRYIKTVIEGDGFLRHVSIEGEVSNFKRYPSGHCYFTLKDEKSCLKCVMFRSRTVRIRFQPENGMQVVATGRIAVYDRDGVYQLYVDRMIPDGVGDLALAYEALREKLLKEGLFDEAHKKPLPPFPRRIGVVTSIAGAVLRDIHRVSKRRFKGVQIVLLPVAVQGSAAASEIASAIRFFNRGEVPVDLLIVGRGGGSIEDLWAFNEEPVVRAIYESEIPIISAVGHQTDYTLSDFASDVRAATPSQAAELAVPDAREILQHIRQLEARLCGDMRRSLDTRKMQLEGILARTPLSDPHSLLAARQERVDRLLEKMQGLSREELQRKKHSFTLALERLEALNPARVLLRGYSLVEKQGRCVRSVVEIDHGDALSLRLSDGIVPVHAD